MDPELLALLAESGVDMPTLGGLEQPEIIGGIAAPTTASTPQNVLQGSVRGGGAKIYRDGDELDALRAIPLELRVQLQEQMMALGIPGTSNIIVGELDDATTNGLRVLMSLGNRSGTSWDATLNRLQSRYDAGGLGGGNAPKIAPYLPPDYATLAQMVKETTRQKLGRDPTQAELSLMSDELLGIDRLSYNAQKQQTLDNAAGREVSVPSVDVGARFSESFESRFQGQLQQAATEDTVRQVAGETQQQLGAF